MAPATKKSYKLNTVSRACEILKHLAKAPQPLSLSDLVKQTGIGRTIVFRLLRSLEAEGMLRQPELRRYVSNITILNQKRFRLGYASQSNDSFSRAVTEGVRWAAERNQLDLIEVDNEYNARAALRNAHKLADQKVDLAIEFQVYERMGRQISAVYEKAGIPVIAIEIPQPGASFFGVDNYSVGQLAGKTLLRGVQRHWHGTLDELLLLDLEAAGSLPHLRISAAESTLRKGIPGAYKIHHLDSRGEMDRSFELVRRHLYMSPKRRTLICAVNDLAALGALRAFAEVGRSECCLALGIGALPEARQELRTTQTRLIGSIATFPERYGDNLIQMALDILSGRPVPPAVYAQTQLVTPQNIEKVYPRAIYGSSERVSVC